MCKFDDKLPRNSVAVQEDVYVARDYIGDIIAQLNSLLVP